MMVPIRVSALTLLTSPFLGLGVDRCLEGERLFFKRAASARLGDSEIVLRLP
jgi:hypothetical protein